MKDTTDSVGEPDDKDDEDYDDDGVIDKLDEDDDNDGIPDVFEFKYSGSYKGPWKPAEDRRAALCPNMKLNLPCGENSYKSYCMPHTL